MRSSNVQPSAEEYRELGYGTSNLVRAENGSLTIVRATEDDEGYYMCAANNGVGAGKSTFIRLMVHGESTEAVKRYNWFLPCFMESSLD